MSSRMRAQDASFFRGGDLEKFAGATWNENRAHDSPAMKQHYPFHLDAHVRPLL